MLAEKISVNFCRDSCFAVPLRVQTWAKEGKCRSTTPVSQWIKSITANYAQMDVELA